MEHIVQGRKVLIDAEDEAIFQQYKWHISDSGYVIWRGIQDGKKQTIRLHRLIANTPDGLVTDHINRNKLDNRRCNLRCTTTLVNVMNRDVVINAKGYYLSSSKCRKHNKWVVDYKGVQNTFATEEEAKNAVKAIKNGTFVKSKDKNRYICSVCGKKKELYGGVICCKDCLKRRQKEYYKRLAKRRREQCQDQV